MMSNKKVLTINTDSLPGYKKGDKVTVETKGGIIKDKYWRNRLSDAKIDNCVLIADNGTNKQLAEKNNATS